VIPTLPYGLRAFSSPNVRAKKYPLKTQRKIMSSLLLTAPAVEPLSLAEAKAFLRVEHNDDDPLITALIASSRMHIETETRSAFITQSWRIVLDSWPENGRIEVRPAPLRALTAARVYDANGVAHVIDIQAFVPNLSASTLAFMPSVVMQPGRIAVGIELDVSVGYGGTASDVPEPLRQAMRFLIAHWYENRGLVASSGGNALVPVATAALLAPYRMLCL
jgi:uncharacterized phiE125 gp8 family phage protein